MHRRVVTATLMFLWTAAAVAQVPSGVGPRGDHIPPFIGSTPTELDLLRPVEGGSRIYVQAELPAGRLGLFLVDTGADISVLSEDAAQDAGLDVIREWGTVQGLSGSASTDGALVPWIRLGDVEVSRVEVAINVPGVGERAGLMPLDGILGNNIWSRFIVEIDYPADTLVLHAPDSVSLPRRSAPMLFDGHHIYTPLEVRTRSESGMLQHSIVAQVDTGASELTLCAATGARFPGAHSEGLEPVRGIGASDHLPPFRFLEMTRRVAIEEVVLGGRRQTMRESARWLDFDNQRSDTCAAGFRALLGHDYLVSSRLLLDYGKGRLHLGPSKRRSRQLNGHGVLYEQDVARYGTDAPQRGLERGMLLLGDDRLEDAIAAFAGFLDSSDATSEDLAEARVWLASLYRQTGDLVSAWQVLEGLSAADLVDQDQIVATVNGLVFENRTDQARRLADEAIATRPEEAWARVARADVRLLSGDATGAREDLLEAARLEQYPDAHLIRRARVALAVGDRHGSMAYIRKLLELYPHQGQYLWFYALLIEGESEAETFRNDLNGAMKRLHPHTQPFDFLVAAHRVLGDTEVSRGWMRHGIAEHCDSMPPGPAVDNCLAWYWSLAGENPDDSLLRIQRALSASGPRADFLDTKAMVHVSRGELPEAHAAALRAARLSPGDPYMLWQAERIGQLAERKGHEPSPH